MSEYKFATIEEAVEEIKKGNMLIVADDEDRENEGDFIFAAEKATPEMVNFITKYGRGLVCCPATEKRLKELQLPMMVEHNTAPLGTAFTVSVDALKGTTTGISCSDRAITLNTMADENAKPEDLGRPGHIHPLRAMEGGVLVRSGHTEAVVDLCKMAGLKEVGVLCEILNEDGTMARMPQLQEIAKKFDLKVITIAELIKYRREHENLVYRSAECKLPTEYGDFNMIAFETKVEADPYIALTVGDVSKGEPCLVRVHSACFTGDVLGSKRCDCGEQLHNSMRMIAKEGRGAIIYIQHHEGRGIGLVNKCKAYKLQEKGRDTVDANLELGFPEDMRDYSLGAQVIKDLGITKMRLLTNNPKKYVGLSGFGLEIVERVPIVIKPNEINKDYLDTKRERMGHLL